MWEGGEGTRSSAVLSWDSMNTAGPFQRQSGCNRQGGWAASHSLFGQKQHRRSCVREGTIRNMLRIVSSESCSYVNSVWLWWMFSTKPWSWKEKQPPSRGCLGNSDIWEDATMDYNDSTLEDGCFLNVLMRPVAGNENPSILTHREVKWSIAPVQNVGHTYSIIHVRLYLYSVV